MGETYTYPEKYETNMAGQTVPAVYPKQKGLVIVSTYFSGPFEERFKGKYKSLVHVASGYTFGNYQTLALARRAAVKAAKLLDFSSFETVEQWKKILKNDKELCAKLKVIANR